MVVCWPVAEYGLSCPTGGRNWRQWWAFAGAVKCRPCEVARWQRNARMERVLTQHAICSCGSTGGEQQGHQADHWSGPVPLPEGGAPDMAGKHLLLFVGAS